MSDDGITCLVQKPQCPVCLDSYQDPRMLTCGHSLCIKCVKGIVSSTAGSLRCPLCQNICSSGSNPDQLPKNYLANEAMNCIKELGQIKIFETAGDKQGCESENQCIHCKQGEVAVYCRKHRQMSCAACAFKVHRNCPTTDDKTGHEECLQECNAIRSSMITKLSKAQTDVEFMEEMQAALTYEASALQANVTKIKLTMTALASRVERDELTGNAVTYRMHLQTLECEQVDSLVADILKLLAPYSARRLQVSADANGHQDNGNNSDHSATGVVLGLLILISLYSLIYHFCIVPSCRYWFT